VKILLATDGSNHARKAVDYVIKHSAMLGKEPDLTLVHVQARLPNRAAAALSRAAVDRYYQDQSERALAPARRMLRAKAIAFKEAKLFGEAGETIASLAIRGKFSLIVMGSRGMGGFGSIVLGSVAHKVLASCKVPALIIR
jgi:nucleotide-binding universal stress UspA family protein